ncbi:MAG: hypothetical protein JXL80_07395, partial [Planctomycetes bacterium]|nr:hypothetical protein [Planctomycetota bacterium]
MTGCWAKIILMVATSSLMAVACAAQDAGGEPAATVVLDTAGFWRMHNVLQPPVIGLDGGPRPMLFDAKWLDTPTAEPAAGWERPDFDDGGWMRAPVLRFAKTPYLARLCLRGKFEVSDPAKVRDLKLTLGYYGGAVVYLNGTEIARQHMPAEAVGRQALAEPYPREAFAVGDKLIGERNAPREATAKAASLRERVLADVPLPAKLLRKGVNVVAVDLVRAPYHKVQKELRRPVRGSKELSPQLMWNTCEVRRIQVTAASGEGLTPCAVRPKGMQVYNSDLMMSDFDMDWGDPNESLRPVQIVAPQNGRFSGKVVVGCDEPLRGLKATAGDLAGPGGAKIPASAIRLRYAVPHGSEYIITPYTDQQPIYPCSADVLTALLDEPLDEFPVVAREPGRYDLKAPNQPQPVFGAVVPLWITVYVSKAAAAGTYKGQVRISAAGHEPVAVPVEVKVVGWTVPDTQDYRTWVDLVESPDTLTEYYKVPLWSDEHWRMIGEAFKAIGEAGSRMVYVPLIAQTNIGHEQSMVRWIRKADGSYDYDLSVMDRYLDTAVSQMGRPKIVALWIWEIYMMKNEQIRKDHLWLQQAGEARKEFLGKGPLVT